MKLIECYVNNFGVLSDFSFDFKDGLNVIKEENGFGKSTLAAFIKSMLFGLEDTKRPSLSENDRKKYEPWQGGSWGGSLTLSCDKKTYRIERSFFKKASLDEIRVFDTETEKPVDIFSEKSPGEFLLGIDRDGFERTVFLSERDIDDKKVNNSVSAKLSRLTGVAFDMSELDGATKILDEERKHYQKHGGSGAIAEIKEKISELDYKRRELLSLEAKHEEDAKVLLEKENEIKKLKVLAEKEIEEEKKSALLKDRYQEYKRKLAEKQEYDLRAEKIKEFFAGKIPEKETIYTANSLIDELAKLNKERAELESKLSLFPATSSESDIDDAAHLSLKIRENHEKIKELESEKTNTGATRVKKIKLLSIVGASLIALGAALAFLLLPLVLISALGAALLIAALSQSNKNDSSPLSEKIDAVIRENDECEKKLAQFFTRLGLEGASSDFAIPELRQRNREKEALLRSLSDKNERLSLLHENYQRIILAYPTVNDHPSAELSAKSDSFAYLASSSERLAAEIRELAENFNFTENCEFDGNSGERARDRLILKERELSLLKNAFSLDEVSLEELDVINASLESLREEEKAAEYKFETIKKTKNYLEAAKDSLTLKYLGKTREAFSNYVESISKSLGKFGIDTSFQITKNEGGQTRAKDSYSKGTKQLYDFALRLSFSDSLYEGELPFLMLDDPFAYFDDIRLDAALSLIGELSKTRQIIYFTATESRT